MRKLSISDAWTETLALVKREGRLLFPVAFALYTVPSVLVQFLAPEMSAGEEPEPGE